ncbi:hypothetical protein M231_06844 [Tremella mesenterica]|uniref:Uncharacterized protein n=1 Tax=Tremella mesenterica TaxID=5217 RepID=A0A4V1M374_TREME|nr:hypothetical protein M231_06844 [Tremella mesenterica]
MVFVRVVTRSVVRARPTVRQYATVPPTGTPPKSDNTLLYAAAAVGLAGVGYYFFAAGGDNVAKGRVAQAEGHAKGAASELSGKAKGAYNEAKGEVNKALK